MYDHEPASQSAKLELEAMMRKSTSYPLLAAVRHLLRILAVLAILGGWAELFLFSLKPDSYAGPGQ